MTRLRHGDLAAFSKGLETLYGAGDMASLPGRVTSCLRELFGCDLASFDLLDLSAVRWSMLVASPVVPNWDAFLAALQYCAHDHPIVTHATQHHYPHAIRTSDLRSLRQYRQSKIYRELCVPYVAGMDRQLGFVAKPSATLAFGVSVNRRGRDFSAEQRTLLELLRPHLLQAHTFAKTLQQIHERERSLSEEAADAIGGGICQLDPEGRLEWTTRAAEPLLTRYFPAWRSGSGFLPAELRARLDALFGRRRKDADGASLPGGTWHFPRAFGTLKVQMAVRHAARDWRLLLTEKPGDLSAEALATRHGLTRREGDVFFWIAQGKSSEEIGIILSVSVRTVEKHTEHLFEKLRIYNRAAAVRVALGG